MRGSRAIVVSDDDDSETEGIEVKRPSVTPDPIARPAKPTSQSNPIIRPAVFDPSLAQTSQPVASSSSQKDGEEIKIPDFPDDYRSFTSEETEKQLRELMGNSMNQDIAASINLEEDSIVPGFREGIKLLPHQIVGRTWMKDRETGKKAGGILADDMGLGKTIQTLSRIVEGKPHKSDRDDGWSGCTLVVCPLALVSQWASEVEKMTGLRVIKHQGQNRTTDPAVLRRHHIVVTTYDTVKFEYDAYTPPAKDESKKGKAKSRSLNDSDDDDSDSDDMAKKFKKKAGKAPVKKCALFGIRWWRIVLDEAHTIKNVKTKGAIACCELEGKFRWCLTGTPMQNNVSEIQSLFKFLRVKPYSDVTRFNVDIAKPISSGRGAGRAMKRLQVILKSIMLRRRKEDTLNGKALIELPARNLEIISCSFDPHEKVFYESLEQKMETVLDKLMANSNGGGSNYMSVLLLLLRLRQACNHPLLVSKDFKKDAEAIESTPAKSAEDPQDDDLIAAFGQLGVSRKCQMFLTLVILVYSIDDNNSGLGEWKNHCTSCVPLAKEAKMAELERPTSAKIRMVLKILRDIDEKSNSEEKTIIFSQFTSMLDLIEPFLKEAGVKFVRYDGSMMPKEREVSLEKIRNNAAIKVILISFKAGSTGLNLTSCNHVILVDMWWNPAMEDQAFDRAHRFGQKRDVSIYKLKIDGTVEDRILELQAKKRALSQAALSGDKIKNMRLRMEDLLALFRPGRDDEDD
ncbi:hypothetical protein EST38_g2656 [Candolleomyces aberdarensis]|uniref:Uncharacterized protein n=2 Tax=Candolleomyces aberdarensis TaxID=2316362 RepID=A0A4Q2DRX0_9AGAR|nr:hypothetical protein EST38_g2656 [Candolleomyces aberdarensis]